MTETRRITFNGSGVHARALVQTLQAEGVNVTVQRGGRGSVEYRDAQSVAEAVIATLIATGMIEAIKVGVGKFKKRFPGADVHTEGGDD